MNSQLVHLTSKIISLSRSGLITQARKLFDEMPHKDTIAWNAMLTSYSQLGLHQNTLSLFQAMRLANTTTPDDFTFAATLNACAGSGEFSIGTKAHALVILMGYTSSLAVSNALIDMYGKCFRPVSARGVFDEMGVRNEVTWCSLLYAYVNCGDFGVAKDVFGKMPDRVGVAWNVMISGYARCGEFESCLELLKEMVRGFCLPDKWTLSAVVNACGEGLEGVYGYMVHGYVIKSGWSGAVEVENSILSFYAKLGYEEDAAKVFRSIDYPSLVSWNAIIDALMRKGDVDGAVLAFDNAPEKNVVSWTSVIAGCARNGHGEKALTYFVDMMRECCCPDDFTFGAVLHACSGLAALGPGKMIHGSVVQNGFQAYAYVGNGLINMYAKCGDIYGSRQAFDDILHKDLVSWNAMLFGYGLHGWAYQALHLYEDMVSSGTKPDKVTFIGLLMTCSHAGLVDEGCVIYDSMESVYGISPDIDHLTCVVDMLGRGGYLAEAKELANKHLAMHDADVTSREPILGASSICGDIEMGAFLAEDLMTMEPQKDMSYVLLSNLYCSSGKWKEAEMVRKTMAQQGVKKMPGCSWIEVRNKVTAFVSGKYSHPCDEMLCKALYLLEFEMKNPYLNSLYVKELDVYTDLTCK